MAWSSSACVIGHEAGVAVLPATGRGTAWHGDPVWERAVGMMQFLLATFRAYGVAADGGACDRFDPADAAFSAAGLPVRQRCATLAGVSPRSWRRRR